MSNSPEKKSIEVKLPFNLEIKDIKSKNQYEVILNEIAPGKGIVVRKMTKGGLAEQVFIVYLDGNKIKWFELK